MLPPVFISLPFKILLFVLVDGWNLVTRLARAELPHLSEMDTDLVISLGVSAMELALKVALPLLLVGLVVGLIISVFQAVTQIQEQTLTFIPKILATIVGAGRRRPVDARPAPELHARPLDLDPEAHRG